MTRRGLVVVLSLVVIGCTATPKRQTNGSTGGDSGETGGAGGGSATGGKPGTGGSPGTGGAMDTGGAVGTGGSPGTGGAMDTGGSGGDDAGIDASTPKDAAGKESGADSGGGPEAGGGGKAVLLVTAATPTAGDTALKTKLTTMGLTVTMADETGPASAANGKALVVITSSGMRGVIADKFKATAVPVLVMKSGVMAAMSMTTPAMPGMDTETMPDQTDITISDAASPLAAGFPAGNVKVYTAAARIVAGAPAAAATKVATVVGMPALVAIFSYAANDAMVGGFKAPAKRIGFFIHQTATLNDNGLKLFEAAVNWARQ